MPLPSTATVLPRVTTFRFLRRSTAFRLPRPDPRLVATVIIPVRNEAEHIAATLGALMAQRDLDGARLSPESFEVLVLANNCSDDTAGVARRFAARWKRRLKVHVLEARFYNGHANVGHARRVLMDLACARLEAAGNRQAMIASTDGDTQVDAAWLAALHAELRGGADAVGGRIVNGSEAGLPRELARLQRQDTLYQLLCARVESLLDPDPADPWPRHHQHFGANFAVRASAYRAVGGLPDVQYLEDEALFAALRQHDLCLRHSSRARVRTSVRRDGRASVGLSWQLREWQRLLDDGRQPRAETAASFRTTIELRHRLRLLWQHGMGLKAAQAAALRTLASRFGLEATALLRQVQRAKHFGALWAELEPAWRDGPQGRRRHAPLRAAIEGFRLLVRQLEADAPRTQPRGKAPVQPATPKSASTFRSGSSAEARLTAA